MKVGIPPDFRSYLSLRGSAVDRAQEAGHQPLTLRALLVGSFLSFFLGAGSNYADIVIKGSYMTLDFSAPGAVFLFLVLVGLLNVVFKWVGRRPRVAVVAFLAAAGAYLVHYAPFAPWLAERPIVGWAVVYLAKYLPFAALVPYSPGVLFSSFVILALLLNALLSFRGRNLALNRSELIVVYIMLLVTAALSTMGLCETLLPAISGMFYYASPDNHWSELLLPHLPTQVLVDDGSGNRAFFEGMGAAKAWVPYAVWFRPLFLWGIFLLALYMAMISLAVILRRQWMDRERLAYPLVQVAQAMIRGEDEQVLINPFFKSRSMWIGAATPMVVGLFTGLSRYFPGFPVFPTAWSFPIYGGQAINMTLSFAVLGFSYLISPDIAAGIWGFALLAKAEKMVFVAQGVVKQQEVWAVAGSELLNYQGLGSLLAYVLMGLWVGREHLKEVGRKFLGLDSQLRDDDEIMSYRAAVLSLVVGVIAMVLWLGYLGTPWWAGLMFVVLALLIFVGLTRVVAESGIPALISPMVAPDFMVYGLGSTLLGVKAIANFSLAYIYATDIRVFLMGMVAQGLKLIEGMDRQGRRYVFWAILVAIFLGITGSLWTAMELAYKDGGINSSSWFFNNMPNLIYQTAVKGMEPAGVYWKGMGFLAGGAGGMLALLWLRQRFLWWPLHPIGFPIMSSWLVDWMWFSVFFAWLIKIIILKYGGASLFSRSRNFFLGIIVGRMLISGLWLVVDFLAGKVGNTIFWI